MLKFSKLLIGTGILCLGLAGCGTSEQESSAKKETEGSAAEQAERTASQPSKAEENSANTPAASEKQNSIRIMEQNLQYSLNGANKQETAFLKNSDNQDFSMYVLPDFELSAEEPEKDIVFLKAQDSVFMRIELLAADSNWEEEEEMAKTQLMAVSDKITTPGLPKFDLKNAEAFEASNEEDNVTVILIKDEKNPVKLTIFTKKENDYRSAFLEMAKTIMKKPAN
ncbi:hypothetical protein JOC77_002589 [Peribacillus deserti]|uniref:Lipoprotein n=1 Tax=Peribacillus deserti TaxID=673318 RepID=A0ABS2QJI0_9BACI|nr:hypothetical protein [Peribacillus deserti]MBM7693150.1 hypothetical protein [Peribacillus deserti]